MSEYENKFGDYTDNELINSWNKAKLNSFEKLYIYKELYKRNKLYLLDRFYLLKYNKNEYICAKFKQGCLTQGGISSDIGTICRVFFMVFLGIVSFSVNSSYLYCFPITSCISESTHFKILMFCFFLLMMCTIFFDIFISSYILITNKSIIFYKHFFLLFVFTSKKIVLNNVSIINNINNVRYLSLNNKPSSIIIRYKLFIFNILFSKINYILKYNLAVIFDEWVKTITLVNNSKCYMVSLDNLYLNTVNKECLSFCYNYMENYHYVLKDISSYILSKLINYDRNFYFFLNYLSLLSTNSIDFIDINDFNYNFLYNNEIIVSILPNKSEAGFRKSTLILTNKRLIETTNNNIYLASYYLSDKNLIFISVIFGISVYYNKMLEYTIYWSDINIPLLDYIKSRRNYE